LTDASSGLEALAVPAVEAILDAVDVGAGACDVLEYVARVFVAHGTL